MFRIFSAGRTVKYFLLGSVLLAVLLSGCGGDPNTPTVPTTLPAEATEPDTVPTAPPDGEEGTVTERGSYTSRDAQSAAAVVVAKAGDAVLINSRLQVYYRMEVAAWQQGSHEISPDFTQPLDTQLCELDEDVVTWQQFFLKRALNTWHSAQALEHKGQKEGLPLEEAYKPNTKNHEEYMTGMPALVHLYGYDKGFEPNELHQAYLDGIPAMLEELAAENGYSDATEMAHAFAGSGIDAADLASYARLYNRSYMYLTNLSYYLEQTEEDILACFAENRDTFAQAGITEQSGRCANIRQILVLPDGTVEADGTVTATEEQWETGRKAAQNVLRTYESDLVKSKHRANKTTADAVFAALANKQSMDAGTALDGGLYQMVRKGQLPAQLEQWVFDEARQPEDVELIRSEYGYHIVFITRFEEIWHAEARQLLNARQMENLIRDAREQYPMEVNFRAIRLGNPSGEVNLTPDRLLYADIAHQRYPSAPLYLQQDYPDTMYGNYKITSHGCGITTMAMLASYMADDELTPPEMCARYGGYCYKNGTDGILFVTAPSEMGFYLKERTFQPQVAKQAMKDGYVVVCVQHKGYWTRGGHYLLMEKMFEGDIIQVRDSNIYNYGRLARHKEDRFPWDTIPGASSGFWIFENKVVTIPGCSRCGTDECIGASMIQGGYICEKCTPALLRRNTYMNACGMDVAK